jgi:diguanylate cyclase (GGDEF)-like protein
MNSTVSRAAVALREDEPVSARDLGVNGGLWLRAVGARVIQRASLTGLPNVGQMRVWALVAAIGSAATYLYVAGVGTFSALAPAPSIPWPILAALFFIAEVKVVHFQFRSQAHSLSLNEVPFVLGLFYVQPAWFLVALLAGSGMALAVHRRQTRLKLLFNLAQLWLAAEVALIVLHRISVLEPIVVVDAWVAPFIATLVNGLVGVLAIAAAMSLSEGRLLLDKLPAMLKLSTVVTVTNTSVALLAVTILSRDPAAVWLLLIPIVAIFLAYKGLVAERQKHERLALLYESTRILQHAPELDAAVVAVLRHAQTMFRSEFSEIVLDASETDRFRTTVGPGRRVDRSVETSALAIGHAGVVSPDAARIVANEADPMAGARPDGRVVRNAVIAPLRGEARRLGTLMVANRLGDVSSFGDDDLQLFETMANHISVALENGQLEQSLARLTQLKDELRYQALHDPLTALGNRTLLVERIEQRLAGDFDAEAVPVVLFLDLDDFKIVNDSLGHSAGDALLAQAGDRIRQCLRGEDVAARLGGDEFAVLLVDGPELANAQMVARRVQESLRAPFVLPTGTATVRVSVGLAAANEHTATADELLGYADVAMYMAKARGKAQVVVFEPTMRAAVVHRHELGEELGRAVANDEFAVHYQPIVDLASGQIHGFEALVRWRHPERGLIHPAAFVSVAEEIGIIVPLGRWVLGQACRQVRAWNLQDPTGQPRTVSVNLSARQLQQTTFVDDVKAALASSGLDASLLMLEVTETTMLQDTSITIRTLEALRTLGVRIAVDDFGTGYSSLSYLRRFPVDVLKIAREFTDTGDAERDVAFADAIIAMGRALGISVVAEGIEREDQLARLRDLGCAYGQGYYLGRPLPAARIETLLHASSRRPRLGGAIQVANVAG